MGYYEIVKTGFNVFEVRKNGITIGEYQTRDEAREAINKLRENIFRGY